jgi:hypothetical protein
MTALEQEIFDRLIRLDADAQDSVLRFVEDLLRPETDDLTEWLDGVRSIQADIQQQPGQRYRIDTLQLLHEVREEVW